MPILHFKNRIRTFQTRNTLLSGLVDYWTFDSNANTSTASGNNGTVNGATNVAAKINNGYSFTGTNYISVGTTSTYKFFNETAHFSISVWMKLTNHANDAARTIIATNGGASAQAGIWFSFENRVGLSNPKCIRVFLTKGVSGQAVYDYYSPNNAITDDNWHHVVVTSSRLGSATYNVNTYIDGVKLAAGNVSLPYPVTTGNSTNPLYIGVNNAFTSALVGSLDELAFWNRALFPEEVKRLYNAGTGRQYPF